MHHPTDRITHTTTFVTPVVEHWPIETQYTNRKSWLQEIKTNKKNYVQQFLFICLLLVFVPLNWRTRLKHLSRSTAELRIKVQIARARIAPRISGRGINSSESRLMTQVV